MNKYRTPAIAATLAVAMAALTGCGSWDKAAEPYEDASRGAANNAPADTITMPDGFSNLATKCDHGNRVYVAFKGDNLYASIAVVPNDLTCPKP